jgi:ABC-2 type transport system ATP-binding protein
VSAPLEASTPVAITVRGLTKRYGRVQAVRGLGFEVPWGTVAGFLGPNGAGKTTTMRILMGLVRPTAGATRIAGQPFDRLAAPATVVGALLDASSVHPGRTGRSHLRILAAHIGIDGDHRVDQLLDLVELGDAADGRVRGYSMGMRQRLGLAAALLGQPRVLILDEPANGLDPAGINWLRGFLREFASRGGAAFVSSHLLAEMAQLADDVVVIDRGRLVIEGPVSELTARWARRVHARTPAQERLREALARRGIDSDSAGDGAVVVLEATPEVVGAIAAEEGVVLYGLDAERESLEDVFLALTGGPPDGRKEARR